MRWVFSGLGLGFPIGAQPLLTFSSWFFFPKGTLELALCVSRLSEWGLIISWKLLSVYESVVKILLLRRRRLVAMAHPANSGDPMRDQQNDKEP